MRRIRLARFLLFLAKLLPKRYPIRSMEQLPQPFFIFGSGRNGSTLLNLMLNQHQDIFLPTEQYFLGNTIIKYQLYNFLNWRDLAKILAGELIPTLKSHWWEMDMQTLFAEIVLMEKEKVSLERIIYSIYQAQARDQGKKSRLWGDATNLITDYVEELYSVYPQSKYIFLLRDGRDVVASYKKGGEEEFGRFADIRFAANYWVKGIEKYDYLRKRKANVLLVTYEDLTSNPEKCLGTILQHLGLDEPFDWKKFYNNIPNLKFFDPVQHHNIRKPVFTHSIGKWQSELNSDDLALLQPILSPYLRRFDYL